MEVWKLLKAYVREFEVANSCMFSNEAWQRIKQLERDINAIQFEAEDEKRRLYHDENEKLRALLKSAVHGRVVISDDLKWEAQIVDGQLVVRERAP